LNKILYCSMKFVNINNIEDLVISKYIIESYKLKEKLIESKQPLNDFINDLTKSMYALSLENMTKIINFGVIKIPSETFVYVTNDDESEQKIIDEYMSKIDYDLNKTQMFNMNSSYQSNNVPSIFIIKGRNYYKI